MPNYINFTPKNINSGRFNFFEWFRTKGKYVVLGVNIILFCLFIYNLNLSRENIILANDINDRVNSIRQLENKATLYTLYQDTTNIVSVEETKDVDSLFLLAFLKKSTPSGIVITSLSSDGDTIKINATSSSSIIFSTFLDYLSNEPRFTSVRLTSSNYQPTSDSFVTSFEIN